MTGKPTLQAKIQEEPSVRRLHFLYAARRCTGIRIMAKKKTVDACTLIVELDIGL